MSAYWLTRGLRVVQILTVASQSRNGFNFLYVKLTSDVFRTFQIQHNLEYLGAGLANSLNFCEPAFLPCIVAEIPTVPLLCAMCMK